MNVSEILEYDFPMQMPEIFVHFCDAQKEFEWYFFFETVEKKCPIISSKTNEKKPKTHRNAHA